MTKRLPEAGSLAALLAFLALTVLIGCLLDDKQAGRRGSEVENEVYGVLVAADGAPVAGARVKAYPSGAPVGGSGNVTDSASTDANGRYAFRGLPIGTYNLLGDYQSGALVVLITGVDRLDTLVRDSVGIDTLRAPGRIRGRLLLGNSGYGGALAYLPGTSYLAVSDDSGRFLLTGVPQGRYGIQYSAAGFLVDPDTGIFVPAGVTVELPAKRLRHDPALAPPAPQGLTAAFDTLHGRALLSWGAVDVSDLDGYLVFRDQPGQVEPVPVNGALVRDTFFVDSAIGDPGAYGGGPIVYRVKSRDKRANSSMTYSGAAFAPQAPVSRITTTVSWSDSLNGVDTIALGDTPRLIAAYANPTRLNRRLTWRQSGRTEPLAVREVSALSGSDTLDWRASAEGEWSLTLAALDAGGTEWSRSRVFRVVRNSLLALAGPDTTVSLGDSVILTAAAKSRFGRYVGWEWDLGATGRFVSAAQGTLGIRVPRAAGAHTCILHVTDAFGDSALDTVRILVLADPPEVEAKGDTTVSIGDSVRVTAAASDRYGKVVKWEWRACADTAFREAAASAWLKMGQTPDAACEVRVRVTDDDGQTAEDTVRVRVEADPPRAEASGDTTVSLGDSVRVTGKGMDGFGRIVKWEWKQGGAGGFLEGGPAARFAVPREPAEAYPIVLRVTDDDGQTGLDTVRISILLDPPSADAVGGDTVSLNDSLRLESKGADGFGAVGFEWSCGPNAPFVKAAPGKYRVIAPATAFPRWSCILRVTDEDGLIALDTAWFTVLRDAPVAVATATPTGGAAWDMIRLSSAGSADRFGRIVSWDWDIGATGNFKRSGSDTTLILPAAPGPIRCVLRATDDDGQVGLDTVEVTVFVLTADAGKDTSVAPGGHLSLRGKVPAGFGPVAKWEWDIGATGVFRRTADGDTTVQLPIGADPFRCVLRATNPAGFFGVDTISIKIDSAASLVWESFKLPAGLAVRYGTYPVEFQDKLWLLGGNDAGAMKNDVWSSDDGVVWTQRVAQAEFPARALAAAVAYNGRLWLLGGTQSTGENRGMNDVWSSADGLKWEKTAVKRPFPVRMFHAAVVFKGQMCVVGVRYTDVVAGDQIAELWCSDDGIDWWQTGTQYMIDWSPHAEVAVGDNGIIYTLGYNFQMNFTSSGATWTGAPLNAGMASHHGIFIAGKEAWILGGTGDGFNKRIWRTPVEGFGPTLMAEGSVLVGLHGDSRLFKFRGQPWIWGVWVSENNQSWNRTYRLKR